MTTFYDAFYLSCAFEFAKLAMIFGEVPIGAVLVKDHCVLGVGFNLKENIKQASKHAELIAIEEASKKLGDWRLDGATLYSSLEPCPMCAGALLQARVKRVVYGAKDLRWGALTKTNMLDEGCFNHHLECVYIPYKPAELLLKHFFAVRRKKQH